MKLGNFRMGEIMWKFTTLSCNCVGEGHFLISKIFVALFLRRLFSQKLSDQRNITVNCLRINLSSNTMQLIHMSEKLALKYLLIFCY